MGWVVNAMSGPLCARDRETVPIIREAGWAPEPVWTGAKISLHAAIRSPDRPARRTLPLMWHYWNDLENNLKWVACCGSWFSAFRFLIFCRHGFCLRTAISRSISGLRHWFRGIHKFWSHGTKNWNLLKVLFKHKIFLTRPFCPVFWSCCLRVTTMKSGAVRYAVRPPKYRCMCLNISARKHEWNVRVTLTLILLTWRIGWAHNNARK